MLLDAVRLYANDLKQLDILLESTLHLVGSTTILAVYVASTLNGWQDTRIFLRILIKVSTQFGSILPMVMLMELTEELMSTIATWNLAKAPHQ